MAHFPPLIYTRQYGRASACSSFVSSSSGEGGVPHTARESLGRRIGHFSNAQNRQSAIGPLLHAFLSYGLCTKYYLNQSGQQNHGTVLTKATNTAFVPPLAMCFELGGERSWEEWKISFDDKADSSSQRTESDEYWILDNTTLFIILLLILL